MRGEVVIGADGRPTSADTSPGSLQWPPDALGIIPPPGRGEPVWAPATSRQDRRDVMLTLETFRIRDELALARKEKT